MTYRKRLRLIRSATAIRAAARFFSDTPESRWTGAEVAAALNAAADGLVKEAAR